MRILLAILFTLFSSTSYAYSPPVGIPDPGTTWGSVHPIDAAVPAAPGSWPNSATSGYYYILLGGTPGSTCTDTANTYGYPASPRCTMPTTFAAGARVEVHGGDSVDRTITAVGTADNPVWIIGAAGVSPMLSGSFYLGSGSQYAIINNMDFNGGTSAKIVNITYNAHHICVRNSWVRNKSFAGNNSGIGISPTAGNTVHDIVVYNVVFANLGTVGTYADEDFHGIAAAVWSAGYTGETYNVWLLENYGSAISGNLVQVSADNKAFLNRYLHHIYVGRNSGGGGRQALLAVKQSIDIILSENNASVGTAYGAQNGDCYASQYSPHNVWWINNKCDNANFGVRFTAPITMASGGTTNVWVSGQAYGGGTTDVVWNRDGHLFGCKSTHTASALTEPGYGQNWAAYWLQSIDDGDVDDPSKANIYIIGNLLHDIQARSAVSAWVSGTAYGAFGNVKDNGYVWHCIKAHTADSTNRPGQGASYTTYWDTAATGTATNDNNIEIIVGDGVRATSNGYWRNGAAIEMRGNSGETYIVNNTLYNVADGIVSTNYLSKKLYLANNLIQNVHDYVAPLYGFQEAIYATATTTARIAVDYELLYDTVNGLRVDWGASYKSTLSALRSASSQYAHAIAQDPLLVSPSTGNYAVQSGSPARGAGFEDPYGVFATFYARYGLSIKKAINGITRPTGSLWTIGAYEYDTGATDTVPPVMTSLFPNQVFPYNTASVDIGVTATDTAGSVAGCKYDTSDKAYASMASSLAYSSGAWKYTLSLTPNSAYYYCYRCIDDSGNETATGICNNFSTNPAPKVKYRLGGAIMRLP